MLHILLLILKIIGIVLLVILGLLLAALLLVLLVPLRYRLNGSWHGGPEGQIRATWLLHAVSVLAAYENGMDITAKLFGFTVFHTVPGEGGDEAGGEAYGESNETAGGEREGKAGGGTADENNEAADAWNDAADGPNGGETVGAMSLETGPGETGESSGDSTRTMEAADRGTGDRNSEAGETAGASAGISPVPEGPGEAGYVMEGIDIAQLPTLDEQLEQDEAAVDADAESSSDDAGQEERPAEDRIHSGSSSDGQPQDAASSDDIVDKIEAVFDRIGEKLEWADRKRRWVKHFLENPKNQKTIRMVWRQATAILRHILPRKAKGRILFGLDDPATTGNVLAACSILYALYGADLTVTPDFENAVIDGELQMKGRIRVGTLAARAVRVVIDRNFWRMIKQVRKFLGSGGE